MQVPMSSYLVEIKPQIQELIRLLEREFDYVSVLCTDVKGTTYRVSMHQTTVGDYHFCERGFVVRAWQDGSYTEYSFNNLTDAADLAEEITSALKSEFQALKALGIAQMESPLVQEEVITKTMQNEIEIDPETVSAEEILSTFGSSATPALPMKEFWNSRVPSALPVSTSCSSPPKRI